MADSPAEKAAPDWERIEIDYRAGILSTREIAVANGISHTAINKRAKKEGWERDLQAKIIAKADALVSKQAVSAEVSRQRLATEREVIEANAERIAQVRGEHRSDIARLRSLALDLMAELEGQTGQVELLEQLGDLLRAPDDNGMDRLNDLYRKIIATPGRIDSAKKLAETMRHAIGLEREAYGIDGNKNIDPPGEIVISF